MICLLPCLKLKPSYNVGSGSASKRLYFICFLDPTNQPISQHVLKSGVEFALIIVAILLQKSAVVSPDR
jgi:hypothetical protein